MFDVTLSQDYKCAKEGEKMSNDRPVILADVRAQRDLAAANGKLPEKIESFDVFLSNISAEYPNLYDFQEMEAPGGGFWRLDLKTETSDGFAVVSVFFNLGHDFTNGETNLTMRADQAPAAIRSDDAYIDFSRVESLLRYNMELVCEGLFKTYAGGLWLSDTLYSDINSQDAVKSALASFGWQVEDMITQGDDWRNPFADIEFYDEAMQPEQPRRSLLTRILGPR